MTRNARRVSIGQTAMLAGLLLATPIFAVAEPGYQCPASPPPPQFIGDQSGNPAYCPRLAQPAFAFRTGPKVLFDEGHHNWGKISPSEISPAAGAYFALGELLKADGYQLEISRGKLTPDLLKDYSLLIIIAPLPDDYCILRDGHSPVVPNPNAFSGNQAFDTDEVSAIRGWVAAGGRLLLNSEHVPFLNSVHNLLEAFDLRVNQDVFDIATTEPLQTSAPSHPIFRGRGPAEVVTVLPILPNVGGGVHLAGSGTTLTRFGLYSGGFNQTLSASLALQQYNAYCRGFDTTLTTQECKGLLAESVAGTTYFLGAGAAPMKALSFGGGRVAVFTEFSTLTSLFDRSGSTTVPYGGLTNKTYTQFVLNTLHWLSGVI